MAMQYWSDRLRAAVRLARLGRIADYHGNKGRGASARVLWGVLIALVDHADEYGIVDRILLDDGNGRMRPHPPTMANIGKCCETNERCVLLAIEGLIQQGFIARTSNPGRSSSYRISWDAFGELPPSTSGRTPVPSSNRVGPHACGNVPTSGRMPNDTTERRAADRSDVGPHAGSLPYRDPDLGYEEREKGSDPDQGSANTPDPSTPDKPALPAQGDPWDDDDIADELPPTTPPPPPTSPSRVSREGVGSTSAPVIVEVVDNATPSQATPRSNTTTARKAEIETVINHWKREPYHPNGALLVATAARRKRINARLDEGCTVEHLCGALDGAAYDDWLMGRSDRSNGKAYRDIDTILRDSAQVERLYDLNQQSVVVTNEADLVWARQFVQTHPQHKITLRLRAEKRAPRLWELAEMRRAADIASVTPARPWNRHNTVQPSAPPGVRPGWEMDDEVMP